MYELDEIAILYVDDEDMNLFLFKSNFGKKYPVFTANSGPEGLKVLEENDDKIIVVISDMSMPGMNGVEFIMKAQQKYPLIGYFILTGCSGPSITEPIIFRLKRRNDYVPLPARSMHRVCMHGFKMIRKQPPGFSGRLSFKTPFSWMPGSN